MSEWIPPEQKAPRPQRYEPPVSRRSMRNLTRWRHRKVAGTWALEDSCPHDLEREAGAAARAYRDREAKRLGVTRTELQRQQRRSKAERLGISPAGVRRQERERQRANTIGATARIVYAGQGQHATAGTPAARSTN